MVGGIFGLALVDTAEQTLFGGFGGAAAGGGRVQSLLF